MPGIDGLLQLGGPFAIFAAVVIAGKYGVDAYNAWRSGRPAKVPALSDAATTNALLLSALEVERTQAIRKDKRIDELENELGELRVQMYQQRDDYERELLELRRQLESVTVRLEGLQLRLRPPPE